MQNLNCRVFVYAFSKQQQVNYIHTYFHTNIYVRKQLQKQKIIPEKQKQSSLQKITEIYKIYDAYLTMHMYV